MLRFKILASVVPLIVVGVFARDRLLHDTADRASVKVQLVDSPEMADFAIVDDGDATEADSCPVTAATRFVAIDERPADSATRIHLSTDPGGDYRVFVSSRRFTAWEAAALIVAARDGRHRLASAF